MSFKLGRDAVGEWRSNWRTVLACFFGVGIMSMPTYITGVFIGPIEKEFGWSRAAISSGGMFLAVSAILLGPMAGVAVDRLGARRIAILGSIGVISGIAALSQVSSSLWTWWAIWALLAIASVFTKPMVWTSAVSSLFTASRGLALAVALCGTAIASTFAPIFCNYLITLYGWRVGFLGLAAVLAVVVLPMLFLFLSSAVDQRRLKGRAEGRPAAIVKLAGVSTREGLTSFRFLRLTIAAMTMVLAAVSCLVNFVPILVASGHPRAAAAGIAGLAGISTVAGRLATGYLIDRIRANLVAAVSVILPCGAFLLLLFAPQSALAAAAAALIIGLSIGSELDTVAYLTTRHFGIRSFGALFAVVGAGLSIVSTGGPFLASLVYDHTHSYAPMLWAYIPISLVGAALFYSLGDYPELSTGEDDAADDLDGPGAALAAQ